MASISGIE